MEDLNLLKNIPLFQDFKVTELMNVVLVAEKETYPRGACVFKEGAAGDALFIIKKGRVRIAKLDSSGVEHTLAFLEAGEYFGEISLVDNEPRSASVYVEEDAEFLKLPRKAFKNLIAGNKELERKFYKSFTKVLCERLRVTNQNLTFSQEINRMIQEVEKPGK